MQEDNSMNNKSGTGGDDTFDSINTDDEGTNFSGQVMNLSQMIENSKHKGLKADYTKAMNGGTPQHPTENTGNGDLSFDSDDGDALLNNSCRQAPRKSQFYSDNKNSLKSKSPISAFGMTNAESESILSMRHMSEDGKAMRTTDPVSSQFNMLNMYVGIALIALPKAVSEVGFIGAIIGLVIVNFISLGASYFLLKARNRFKKQRIIDFPDMANVCFGPATKRFCETILILANCSFAMAQGMYLGGQADLFACDLLDQPD